VTVRLAYFEERHGIGKNFPGFLIFFAAVSAVK